MQNDYCAIMRAARPEQHQTFGLIPLHGWELTFDARVALRWPHREDARENAAAWLQRYQSAYEPLGEYTILTCEARRAPVMLAVTAEHYWRRIVKGEALYP